MQRACVGALDTARELLEFGVLGEGAHELLALRRCASKCGCGDWQECRFRIDDTWPAVKRDRRTTREWRSARSS
jgi:hypothetical protein